MKTCFNLKSIIQLTVLLSVVALLLFLASAAKADQEKQVRAVMTQSGPVLGYSVVGSGPEKVIVLHSWMGTGHSFDPVKPYLDSKNYTFVFADVRGYGKSMKLEGKYTAKEISGDVFRLADQLGWRRFNVIGHSMNGMAAQRIALDDWRQKTRRIKTVIATTPVAADGYPADEGTRKFLWDVIKNRSVTKQAFNGLTGGRLRPEFIKYKTDRHLATATKKAMKGYYSMWIDGDFSVELKAAKVNIPFLVIGGRQDLPGFQEENLRRTFGAWLPNVEFKFITDAGHFPMQETPVYYAALIGNFLEKNTSPMN